MHQHRTKTAPVLDVVVASAGNAPRNLGKLVVVFRVQLHDQRIFLGAPNFVFLDGGVYVVIVPLTALLGRPPWHHLGNLGPADEDEKYSEQQRVRSVKPKLLKGSTQEQGSDINIWNALHFYERIALVLLLRRVPNSQAQYSSPKKKNMRTGGPWTVTKRQVLACAAAHLPPRPTCRFLG